MRAAIEAGAAEQATERAAQLEKVAASARWAAGAAGVEMDAALVGAARRKVGAAGVAMEAALIGMAGLAPLVTCGVAR